MRSSLLQDKRQNCVQRLDLSTPIFYCQPNIFNVKRTARETMLQKLQLPEYLDFANEGCTQLVRNKWQNRMLCLHLSFQSFIVKPCIIVPIASASFWWTQHICYISCQNFTQFVKIFKDPFPLYVSICSALYLKSQVIVFSWFKSTTTLQYKYLFMMWELCCLIMDKILIQVLYLIKY